MQLTIVIRKVNRENSSCIKTVKSLRNKEIELKDIIFIDKLTDIDYGMIKSDWWIVLHDDEYIEDRLIPAIIMGSKCDRYDAFSFYKRDKEHKVTLCPRMFRKGVKLESEFLYPIMPVRIETLLDGWVEEHDLKVLSNDQDAGIQQGEIESSMAESRQSL